MSIVSYEVEINGSQWLDNGGAIPQVVQGLVPDTFYSFRFRSKDGGGNVSIPSAVITQMTDTAPSMLHFRIGCGTSITEGLFEADSVNNYQGGTGTASGPYGGSCDLTGLSNPAPGAVYTRFRYNTAGNTFTYTFPVLASRDYKIRLHYGVHNSPPFNNASCPVNVTINAVAKPEFDPFIDNGSPSSDIGFIKEYTVTQGVGTSLTIGFAGDGSSQPFVMGIEVIEIPPMSIGPFLADGSIGSAYSETLVANDADGAVTWAIASGFLPIGLSLNTSTGEISGTPTTLGSSSFIAQATDSKSPTPQVAVRLISLLIDEPLTAFLLDDITATPEVAYSTRLLRSAYAGACVRVKRASDSTEQDIDFNVNGKLDKSALAAFVAGTTFTAVKWYDQTATGEDLIGSGSTAPTIDSNHFLGVRSGINWGTNAGKQMATVGDLAMTQPKVFMAVHSKLTNQLTQYYFAFDSYLRTLIDDGAISQYNNSGFTNNGRFDGGRKQMTTWFTSGADKVIVDGVDYPAIATASSSTNAGDDARTGQFFLGTYHAGQPNDSFSGVMGEVIVFDGTVSSGDAAAVQASQSAFFIGDGSPGDPVLFHNNVTVEGDSLFAGYGATTNPALELKSIRGSDWRFRNVAKSGQHLLSDMTTDASVQVDPYFNDTLYTKNILIILGGINDFHDTPTLTGATLYAGLDTYVTARKAANPFLQVIVCTITPCDPANGYITSGAQTEKNNFNTLLRGDFSFADGLCDLAARTNLLDPTDTDYYHDIGGGDFGLHFTDLAYTAEIGPGLDAAITALP